MDLDRCRALVCAIETGSLSAAAEALQYTPSGVSRMVAALEAETGFSLLHREHGGVRPTAARGRETSAFSRSTRRRRSKSASPALTACPPPPKLFLSSCVRRFRPLHKPKEKARGQFSALFAGLLP